MKYKQVILRHLRNSCKCLLFVKGAGNYYNKSIKDNDLFRLVLITLNEPIEDRVSILAQVHKVWESGRHNFFKPKNSERPEISPTKWKHLRKEVFDKYGKLCLKCGASDDIVVDHIIPYSKNKNLATDINNLQPLCRSCNSKKGNRESIDYRLNTYSHLNYLKV